MKVQKGICFLIVGTNTDIGNDEINMDNAEYLIDRMEGGPLVFEQQVKDCFDVAATVKRAKSLAQRYNGGFIGVVKVVKTYDAEGRELIND